MEVQTLVANAIYKSQQDRQFQPSINAGYQDFALTQVNSVLGEWRDYIPFGQEVTFNNVDNLLNSTFVSVENVKYIINEVATPLQQESRTRFDALKSPLNLIGFPAIYYFDELSLSIDVFPRPSNPVYQFKVWGFINQVNLGLFDNIPVNMPDFMQNAVTYEVAYRISAEYGIPWSQAKDDIRKNLITTLIAKKSIDLKAPINIVLGRPSSSSGIPPFPYFYYLSGGT